MVTENSSQPDNEFIRLNVNLNQDTADALKRIAGERNISFTEAIRRVISVYHFVSEEQHNGRHVEVRDEKGRTRKITVL